MFAKHFGRLMKNKKLNKKFTERLKRASREFETKEAEKKDPRGPGHMRADCANLKQAKGKACNTTLSDESEEEEEEETLGKDKKFLVFVAPYED